MARGGRALRWHLRASFTGDFGSLPAATYGPTLAAGVAIGVLRVEARGGYLASQRADAGARGGDFDLFTGGVTACGLAPVGRFDLGGCGGVEAGVMRGTSFGVTELGAGSSLWLAVTVGAMGRARLNDRVGVVVEVAGALPLLRPNFVIDNVGAVFQTGSAALRGSAGVEVTF